MNAENLTTSGLILFSIEIFRFFPANNIGDDNKAPDVGTSGRISFLSSHPLLHSIMTLKFSGGGSSK
jgi:hypothetical protein